MTQTHAQIKLTPQPIDVENVISFVSHRDLATSSYSSTSNRPRFVHNSPIDTEAQAVMAKMELDDIVLYAFEEFDINKIAIHYRIGSCTTDDIAVAFAISAKSKKESDLACKAITTKLNGQSENWNEKEFNSGINWIKSN